MSGAGWIRARRCGIRSSTFDQVPRAVRLHRPCSCCETEADYERFKIDRRARTDIATVGPTGD